MVRRVFGVKLYITNIANVYYSANNLNADTKLYILSYLLTI